MSVKPAEPSPTKAAVCVKCGHNKLQCTETVWATDDIRAEPAPCLCPCVFPAPEPAEPLRVDGRKVGLGVQGYPLRKIVERVNGIHVLACGHRLPKPSEKSAYDLCKSRRCVECGPAKPAPLTVEAALKELKELFPNRGFEINITDFIGKAEDQSEYRYEEFEIYLGLLKIGGTSSTLDEAMARVRRWKESQQQ